MAVWRVLRGSSAEPNDYFSMELPGNGICSGGLCSHWWGERLRSDVSLPSGDQSQSKQNKGFTAEAWANLGNNSASRWSEWGFGIAVEGGFRCSLQELLKLAHWCGSVRRKWRSTMAGYGVLWTPRFRYEINLLEFTWIFKKTMQYAVNCVWGF